MSNFEGQKTKRFVRCKGRQRSRIASGLASNSERGFTGGYVGFYRSTFKIWFWGGTLAILVTVPPAPSQSISKSTLSPTLMPESWSGFAAKAIVMAGQSRSHIGP